MGSPNLTNRLAARVAAGSTTSSAEIVGRAAVVRGLHYNDTTGGTAGTVVLKDGGSSGTALITINTPGGGVGMDVSIPAGGIVFGTDVYADLTNVDGVTVFYE